MVILVLTVWKTPSVTMQASANASPTGMATHVTSMLVAAMHYVMVAPSTVRINAYHVLKTLLISLAPAPVTPTTSGTIAVHGSAHAMPSASPAPALVQTTA